MYVVTPETLGTFQGSVEMCEPKLTPRLPAHCVHGAEPSSAVCDVLWVEGQMDGQTDVLCLDHGSHVMGTWAAKAAFWLALGLLEQT